jgi:membrane protease subunit HflK
MKKGYLLVANMLKEVMMQNFIDELIGQLSRLFKQNKGPVIVDENREVQNKRKKGKKNGGLILIILLIVLIAYFSFTSFYTVNETDQAVVTTFGKVSSIESAGLHFKFPSPIQRVAFVPVNITQKLQIGYVDNDSLDSEEQYSSLSNESKMITGDFNIVNIDFFIEWKISDPVKYLNNSDDPQKIIKMIGQSSARSTVGSKNVDGVLTSEKSVIQAEIKDKMIQKTDIYDIGVQIIDVKIQDAEPPTNEVRSAFKAVETAKQEKETAINKALTYKNSTIPNAQSEADKLIRDAESYKESRINEAKGSVARFEQMYTEYAKNREITKTRMYLELIESVFPGVKVYIETSDDGDISKLLPIETFSQIKEQ